MLSSRYIECDGSFFGGRARACMLCGIQHLLLPITDSPNSPIPKFSLPLLVLSELAVKIINSLGNVILNNLITTSFF